MSSPKTVNYVNLQRNPVVLISAVLAAPVLSGAVTAGVANFQQKLRQTWL